ncbi:SDR family oxidoreductase [Actinoplanes bogorensis]|uniref:SDR family oxidoreductase n=1 Tax=Paractinoplanes bogorensis TaxID=1610840 RepID=A0ABS5YX84_9ACTN|nr:SDR family oxidoreductase [Actinoplanes bogorensis]MBU2668053.1 SDR family oxidoreductase [Actinoplanes bogorensis]
MPLTDQRVLIIGGTSGLGLAVARAVLDRGGSAVVASRRRSSVEAALHHLGPGAAGHTVDVQDDGSLTALVKAEGPVDHLVYSAGEPLRMALVADLTADRIREFWMTRYIGALTTIRVLTGERAIRPGGSIVLTSGNAAQRPGPGWALGASVCGAVDALTRQLALELAPIRVNNVAPGVTRSPLWSALTADEQTALYDGVAAALPVGRIAEPEDVALAYVYAMEQPMATGTSILVDGGAVLI